MELIGKFHVAVDRNYYSPLLPSRFTQLNHSFDMMNERLYKSYQNLTNIVFRISDGTEQGKSRAILLNSHIDSTLPSPGAADDAMAVGIMLEVARVLIQSVPRESWFVGWSIIFCESFR